MIRQPKCWEKAVAGTDTIFGLLAEEVDTGPIGITEILPVTVYRKGTFLRLEIESANDVVIEPGDVLDLELNDLGIHLEDGDEAA